MRKFLPFCSPSCSSVPVMTVRTAKNGNDEDLGGPSRNAGPKARPVLYRDVLKEEQFEADRLAILSVFELSPSTSTSSRAVLDSKGKPATSEGRTARLFFDAVPLPGCSAPASCSPRAPAIPQAEAVRLHAAARARA